MTVRLKGRDIAEAVTEYLANRGIKAKDKMAIQVHLKREGWIPGSLEALIIDVPIDAPPTQGPYR